ncbi:MAG: endospore germination permease [Clostridia bacterium]|nr:endospore germination permease [Clostridia bacterium]
MTEKQQTGTWGTVSLIVTLIITKMLISAPSLFAKQSASAGWIEILISGLFELFVLTILLRLFTAFDNMDIIDISEQGFGTVGKVLVGILSVTIFVISSAAVFRTFCELIRNTVIRGIGYDDISFFILAAVMTGAFLGMRTLVSSAGLALPFVVIAIVLVLLINLPRYSVTNILPVYGPGVKTLLSNALLKNASFFELGTIIFFFPYLKDKKAIKKISFTALAISIILSSIITLCYQLAVPYESASTFALPLYQMTRMIKAGTFFQRIEPLNVFIWSAAMFTYISTTVRMAAHIFRKTFSLSRTRPLVFVFSYIVYLTALIPGSETNVERIYDFLMTYSYIAYPLFPLCLLLLSVCISKKQKRG